MRWQFCGIFGVPPNQKETYYSGVQDIFLTSIRTATLKSPKLKMLVLIYFNFRVCIHIFHGIELIL